jgi:hypothetical protein
MLEWRSYRSPLMRMHSRITKLRDKPKLLQTLALQYGPAYFFRECCKNPCRNNLDIPKAHVTVHAQQHWRSARCSVARESFQQRDWSDKNTVR